MTSGIRIASQRRHEAVYRLAECHAVAWLTVLVCSSAPLWVRAAACGVLGIVVGFAAFQGANRMGTLEERHRRWLDAVHANGSARIEGYRLARDDRRLASEDLEEVLEAEPWSPEAREGIRACISQLRWGNHRAHLAEAKRAAGVGSRSEVQP